MVYPKKHTKTLVAVLSLALVASVAACGGDDENNDTANNTTANNTTANNTTANNTTPNNTTPNNTNTGMDAGMEDMGGDDMGGGEDMGMDMGTPFDGYLIFDEGFESGITFAAFDGSMNTIGNSTEEASSGTTSLKVSVPAAGYTGGAYVPAAPVDLSAYNALTFKVKASKAATLNTAGFGNTGQDTTQFLEQANLALTTDWQEVIIPIPDPSLATNASGLFHFAEGSDEGAYDIYFDEIAYVNVDPADITNPMPAFGNSATTIVTGQTATAQGAVYPVEVRGTLTTFGVSTFWFTWTSDDTNVATVDDAGVVTAVGAGSARITATLDGNAVGGELTVNVIAGPTAAAPAPSTAAGDVVASLFSNAYTNVTVDTFRAGFSSATLTELMVAGDDVLVYGALDFVGIEMIGPNSVDITSATNVRFDIWTPNATLFGIKLVDFGADNAFGGGDDTEHQVDLTGFATGQWVSFDLPLTDFTGLTTRGNLSQIILVGRTDDGNGDPTVPGQATVFVDNLYFY